jgi:predicted RNA-binding protein with PUA-like domain
MGCQRAWSILAFAFRFAAWGPLAYVQRMPDNFWLVKQEPADYPFAALVKDGRTAWTGVRNFQARNNLRAMKSGDTVFYYHSGEEKCVVGIAQVIKPAYPDPTATEGDWACVDLTPVRALKKPVSLAQIKADAVLKNMALARQSRLSVCPVSAAEARRLLALGE